MILLRVRNLTIDGHLSAQRLWIKESQTAKEIRIKESVVHPVHTHTTVLSGHTALTSHINTSIRDA